MNKVQVLLFTSYLHIIGGIETFVINFIDLLSPYYDIGVLCPNLPAEMALKIIKRCPLYQSAEGIECDTLVMIRMMDFKPNVKYQKSVRMCHACKVEDSWVIRQDCDRLIHVSEASKSSFKSKGDVIYNPLIKSSKKALLLVSATRIPATDKGRNADRMLELARLLEAHDIPYLWLNFSDAPLKGAPKGFMNVGAYQDLQPFIRKADYLVQLSDQEGFGYSVAEALLNQTAVIVTPFQTTKELGVKDGVNGYIVPFSMDFDVKKLLNVPTFEYEYNNEAILKKWREVFGKSKPTKSYVREETKKVRVLRDYYDVELKENLKQGDVVEMTIERAYKLAADKRRLVKMVEER